MGSAARALTFRRRALVLVQIYASSKSVHFQRILALSQSAHWAQSGFIMGPLSFVGSALKMVTNRALRVDDSHSCPAPRPR